MVEVFGKKIQLLWMQDSLVSFGRAPAAFSEGPGHDARGRCLMFREAWKRC